VKHIKNVNPPNLWSADELKKSGNLTKGLEPNDLKNMKQASIEGAMETLKAVSNQLSLEQV